MPEFRNSLCRQIRHDLKERLWFGKMISLEKAASLSCQHVRLGSCFNAFRYHIDADVAGYADDAPNDREIDRRRPAAGNK